MLKKGDTYARIENDLGDIVQIRTAFDNDVFITLTHRYRNNVTRLVIVSATDLLGAIEHLKRLAFEREVASLPEESSL